MTVLVAMRLELRKKTEGGNIMLPETNAQRKVSGSRIGKIMLGQADEVFDEMTSDLVDAEINNQMLRGMDMEGPILDLYAKKTGNQVIHLGNKVFAHPRFAHHTVMPDALITACGRRDRDGEWLGEVKAHNSHMLRKIKREGIPDGIVMQGNWQCWVMSYKEWEYITLDWDAYEVIHHKFEADPGLINQMVKVADGFWFNHIMENKRPEPQEITPEVKLPITSIGEVVKLDDPEWHQAVADLREARDLKEDATMINAEAQIKLQKIMAGVGADVAEGGGARIYFREQPGRRSFNKDAFTQAHPAINLEPFYKRGAPFKSFRPYFIE